MYKFDISLPLRNFYEIVELTDSMLKNDPTVLKVTGYGHIGDGNLHLNVSATEFSSEVLLASQPFIYEFTAKKGGSISAEHGIGFHKKPYLKYSKNPVAIQLMKDLKRLMDPNFILNPYKVI